MTPAKGLGGPARRRLPTVADAAGIHHVFQAADRIAVTRRGEIAADDLSTKTSGIQDVENVITDEDIAA